MNILKKLSLMSLILGSLFLVSCEDDDDDPATSGTLNITLNLSNAEAWPSEGTVFCSLDKTWPPSGAPYKSVVLQSTQVQNGVISLVFEDLDFDTYALLSVSWLDPNDQNPATNQSVWGTHSGSAFENGQFVFYANATPFSFDVNNSELSLVVNATITTN
ncbi:MAG: hypothetical protein CBE49_002110 [Rickettsiales bacterium TMED289]|jgi:hypothetical protein|nr:MAG: hypothetical protein CBE49_002110 [Rickettsiales bacterium TMED289]|tara:strand:+ start:1740 stop:2219 length:480 start_codon:yes stop_codon:yes gene_type:complete